MQIFSTQSGAFDGFLGWWYALATPPSVPDFAPLWERKLVRRARFTSIILLIEILYTLFSFILSRTFSFHADIIITATIASFVVATILNRVGKTGASSILSFLVIEIGICLNIANLAFVSSGLSVNDLATIPLLILPELIAISLFPAGAALFFCGLNCVFSVAAILVFPKTPELVQLLATSGGLNYFQPVGIQCMGIAVSFFWVRNAEKEMRRADRAEEVGKLTQTLAFQQNTALMEKQQLEENIQQIIEVHMKAASGDFGARVHLEQQNSLWSIGISLNNLLARLQRWQYDERKQQQRNDQAVQAVLYEMRRAKWQGRSMQVQKTGTSLDILLDELSRNMSSRPSPPSPQTIRLASPPPDAKKY